MAGAAVIRSGCINYYNVLSVQTAILTMEPVPSLLEMAGAAVVRRIETVQTPNATTSTTTAVATLTFQDWTALSYFVEAGSSVDTTMKSIENEVLASKPAKLSTFQFLIDNVMKLFQKLKEIFPIPTTELLSLSAREDETLPIIWNYLVDKYNFPVMHDVKQMKAYLADEANQQMINKVKDIIISNNQELKAIPPEIFKFKNLRRLYLAGGKISMIPQAIGNLSDLRILDLSSNEIREIPKTIGNLSNLTSLNLRSNKIREIPKTTGNLSNLINLDLSSNEIREIPQTVGKLQKLVSLKISQNQITSIPDEIGNLQELESLRLGHNQITEIPHSIGNLGNLNELNLAHNKIREIPYGLQGLQNLDLLLLDSNEIEMIPDFLGNLPKLRFVHLAGNRIEFTSQWTRDPNAAAVMLNKNPLRKYYEPGLS